MPRIDPVGSEAGGVSELDAVWDRAITVDCLANKGAK